MNTKQYTFFIASQNIRVTITACNKETARRNVAQIYHIDNPARIVCLGINLPTN